MTPRDSHRLGKTTTATLVARESGRDVLELNASDARSKKALGQALGDVTGSQVLSFDGMGDSKKKKAPVQKRCIIMDEVDGMGAGDRSGMSELIQMIKHSKVPIVSLTFPFFGRQRIATMTLAGTKAATCCAAAPPSLHRADGPVARSGPAQVRVRRARSIDASNGADARPGICRQGQADGCFDHCGDGVIFSLLVKNFYHELDI